MNNENLSERVKSEFEEWKEKYEIPYDKEFQVKTLLKLQEEYDNTEASSQTTLTRKTLLDMIQYLQRNLILQEKKPAIANKILIVDNIYNQSIINLLNMIIPNNIIASKKMSKNFISFELTNGVEVNVTSKSIAKSLRGKKYDYYVNLTGDIEFEREVLVNLLRGRNAVNIINNKIIK